MPAPPQLDRLERRFIGTRVGFSLAAIGAFFGTLSWLSYDPALPATEVLETLVWLIGALMTAIVGDTIRPSGAKAAAFGVKTTAAEG